MDLSSLYCFCCGKVWEESSGESLLQIQLLVALRNFVVALGYQSPICYCILLPILENGIDINSPDELNLLEDSMLVYFFLLTRWYYCWEWIYHENSTANLSVVGGHAFSCTINGPSIVTIFFTPCGDYGKKFWPFTG